MTVGDLAAVITLVAAILFGIWNWVIPWSAKKIQSKWFKWPVKVEVISAVWIHPGMEDGRVVERETDVRIELTASPRKFATSVVSSPNLTGYTAMVNGVKPMRQVNDRQQYLGQRVSRKAPVKIDIPWTPDDLSDHGTSESVELTIFAEPPVGELRKITVVVDDIAIRRA